MFYALAQNKHNIIRPFLREFFENNFQETYFVIKEWPFDEQFNLLADLVKADPSFATLLLTLTQGNPDEGLWRILLKIMPLLDVDDQSTFRRNLLNRNRSISLEPFVKDTDPAVRAAALEFATELKINGLLDLLKKSCKDPSPEVRLKALECLGQQNYPQAQSLLVEALNDPEEKVAYFAIMRLREILGPTKIAPYLARFINSPADKIREFALKEIAEITKKRYKANFNNLNPDVRKLAAKVIQKIDQNFSDQIIEDLSSLDPQVRLQAARLLENIQIDSRGKDALLAAMKDPSKLVRAAVVKTLGVMGDADLIKHLISFFNDPDPRVRANTIEAIASLGDRQAIQILLPFLDDGNNRIRANAIVGIRKIGHVNVVPVLQKMLADRNATMQASALWAMGEIGDENYLGFIYPFLNNRDEMLRFNAIRSISRIKPEVLQPYIANLRKDPSGKIRKLVTSLSYKVL
jgi:HEAT repeat protein